MSRNGDHHGAVLKELERRIESWRRRRPTRAMPEELWEAAAGLAREHGVSAVARALRLGYQSLKQRTGSRANGSTGSPSVRFVEFSPEEWLRSVPKATNPTVELWGRDGSRLVVELPDGSSADVTHLALTLWRGR